MSFSEATLLKKIQELNNTQQSVQTLSLWLIHHRRNARSVVNTWLNELRQTTKPERKITFIYLANDILQNSRRKGDEYSTEFRPALKEAFENTARYSDEKTKFTLERILNIWKDRRIYDDEFLNKLKSHMHSTSSLVDGVESGKRDHDYRVGGEEETSLGGDRKYSLGSSTESSASKHVKFSLREEVNKELALTPNIQPPEPGELIALLQELEKSASSDGVVRGRIAELPPSVSDPSELKNIRDKATAIELAKTVNEALGLLDNYNSRLQQELASRKQTALLLTAYIRHQQTEMEQDQKLIEEWQRRFKQVQQVKRELEIHYESLPDLATIDQVAELTPLPSAGDLFS